MSGCCRVTSVMLWVYLVMSLVVWVAGGVSADHDTAETYKSISSFPRNSDLLKVVMPEGVPAGEELKIISYLASLNRSPTPIIITFLTQVKQEYHVVNLPAARVRTD